MTDTTPDVSRLLNDLFDAERAVRRLHAELSESLANASDTKGAVAPSFAAVRVSMTEASALEDEDEVALRLVRIASLLGEQQGPEAVDMLVDILGSADPESRHAAGEALEGIAWDRFKEVALGVERALERLPFGSPALAELPYILAEVGEPGVTKLLGKFLGHKDPDAVASAMEALVEVGDPSVASMLVALERDQREVLLTDEEGDEERVTIGELAHEARQLLAAFVEPARKTPGNAPTTASTAKGGGGASGGGGGASGGKPQGRQGGGGGRR